MYGDHLPTLGIEEDDLEGADLFQTPYFIWNNIRLPQADRDLEAYQMFAWVLDQLDVHEGIMPKFHQAYFDVDMDAVSPEEPESRVDSGAEADGEEPTNRDVYLHKMKLLEYDMLYGDHVTTDGENPFEATDLQLGVLPIEIYSLVATESGRLYVGGTNFTTSSVLYDGDEALETDYVSPWLLEADISDREVGERLVVSVVQYAEQDHVILSRTDGVGVVVKKTEESRSFDAQSEDPFYREEESGSAVQEPDTGAAGE